jgi:mono/diheme cytochrome c family protein
MLAALSGIALFACSNVGDLREWRPSDHDGEQPAEPADAPPDEGDRAARSSAPATEDLVVDVWRARCARCHGSAGRGDGPEGRMMRAPNLTDPAVQAALTDEELRTLIRDGRGRMPGLGQEGPILDGLVQFVRRIGGRVPTAPATDEAAPGPLGSTATPGSASAAPTPGGSAAAPAPAGSGAKPVLPRPGAERPASSASLPATAPSGVPGSQ